MWRQTEPHGLGVRGRRCPRLHRGDIPANPARCRCRIGVPPECKRIMLQRERFRVRHVLPCAPDRAGPWQPVTAAALTARVNLATIPAQGDIDNPRPVTYGKRPHGHSYLRHRGRFAGTFGAAYRPLASRREARYPRTRPAIAVIATALRCSWQPINSSRRRTLFSSSAADAGARRDTVDGETHLAI